MMHYINHLKSKFFSGHERSVRAKKNIVALFALKGYSILINLALIPITLHLLDDYKYGVWITLFNILSWISIFDIGIGKGLRNKFTDSVAKGRIEDAKKYVSTSYIIYGGISLLLIFIFIVLGIFINWGKILGLDTEILPEFNLLIILLLIFTAIQFTINLIKTLLIANHKPIIPAFYDTISNTIILLIFLIFKTHFVDSILFVGLIYCIVPVILFLFVSIYYFKGDYAIYSPSIRFFDKNMVFDLLTLGMSFFIIQIAVIVLYQTDSLIILKTLSPSEVTPYSIVFRYFSTITMATNIVLTPLWSAYTEAYSKNDMDWIKKILNKQLRLLPLIILIIVLMILSAQTIIPIWIKKELIIQPLLLYCMAFYTLISVWSNIFANLLNGLSKTKIQSITLLIGTIINIPLSIFFAKLFGSGGVILGTIISLSLFAIFGAIESYKFINKRI